MFGIEPSEFLLVAIVALVVIGPKDLPRVMRVVGQWVGRARGMTRHIRSGFDEMVRQAEMEEMEKRWAAENARIMAEHPSPPPEEAQDADFAQPLPVISPASLPAPDTVPAAIEPPAEPGAPAAADQPTLPFATPPAGDKA
jgi:sec-independent protein translocase protein TatB